MISYIIWDLSPEIFDGLTFFRWYGVCWLLGMFAGYRIMLTIYKRESISPVELDMLTTYVVIGSIIGARVGHIIFYDPIYYWNNPVEILPFKIKPNFEFTGLAGLASHGGIAGACLALYFYHRSSGTAYQWLLDRIAIAGSTLGAFIRIGNLMNSEIIGTPSTVPWAFVFTRIDPVPRHPTQLYEAGFYAAVSAVLYFAWKSNKFHGRNGFLCGLAITLIFTQRFVIEFLKEKQVAFEDGLILNMGQMLSTPLIITGIALMIWSYRHAASQPKLSPSEC